MRRIERLLAKFERDKKGKEISLQLGTALANPEEAARLAKLFAPPEMQDQLARLEAKWK